jgi:hypothetical protein
MSLASEFLDKLIGQWDLSGQMGQTPLRQSVEGRWTLGGLFVELYIKSTLPAPAGQKPYEAVYYIGYNEKNDLYVMHLLDTFGVALPYIWGVGKRAGDSIPFVFEYEGGPFTNLFIRDDARDEWRFELTYLQDGQIRTFATKRMVRKS